MNHNSQSKKKKQFFSFHWFANCLTIHSEFKTVDLTLTFTPTHPGDIILSCNSSGFTQWPLLEWLRDFERVKWKRENGLSENIHSDIWFLFSASFSAFLNVALFKIQIMCISRNSTSKKEQQEILPCSSWCMTPTRLGSSPHQNIHNSLQSGLTSRRHTHNKLACRQRMKLNRIGSSWAGAEIMGPQSPCPPKLYLRHLIPVSSA